MAKSRVLALLISVLLGSALVQGHGEELEQDESIITPVQLIFVSSLIAGFFIITALVFMGRMSEAQKWVVFLAIALPVILSTSYLVFKTVSENVASVAGGPVHWHADYEVWACGEKIDIMDPEGFSNRIGSPVIHDHGDNRIHIEGVVQFIEDASLHSFFRSIGGSLTDTSIGVPTNQGVVKYSNGDLCPDGAEGKLQAFAYKTDKGAVSVEKLEHLDEYVISPESQVPPGDCIIIEFTTAPSNGTDKICSSYKAALHISDHTGDANGS